MCVCVLFIFKCFEFYYLTKYFFFASLVGKFVQTFILLSQNLLHCAYTQNNREDTSLHRHGSSELLVLYKVNINSVDFYVVLCCICVVCTLSSPALSMYSCEFSHTDI